MISIGPKAPVTLPPLPSQEVTPAKPATEQHERDPRGREQQSAEQPEKPAEGQDVSAKQPAQPDTSIYAELAAQYIGSRPLTQEQMKAYIDTMRGAREL